jgi:1-acyl-sn-glycerol-3-phosphate acyltransferase
VGIIYSAGRQLGRFCFGSFGRLTVMGRECVPPRGPLLLVANHLSFNDPPVLVSIMDRPLHFIGKQELFSNPVGRFLMPAFNVHPYDRTSHAVDTVKLTLRMLSEDQVVAIFPEGRRSFHRSLQKGMSGAAYIAMKSQAPILPVGVWGTENFPAWRMPFPFCRLTVNIGQPFTLPLIEGDVTRPLLGSMSDMIMYRIAALLPKEYQGIYALQAQQAAQAGHRSGEAG